MYWFIYMYKLFFTTGSIRPQRFLADVEGPVAFQAHMSGDLTHIGLHQKIPFDSVTLNLGNAYHGAHGLYVAPRSGIYIFSGSILAHHTKDIEMSFKKNGIEIGGGILAYSAVNQGYGQGSATVVAQLKAGDEVWIENNYPDDTSIRASVYTCFMGCIIMDVENK
jgi:hypothetical protein